MHAITSLQRILSVAVDMQLACVASHSHTQADVCTKRSRTDHLVLNVQYHMFQCYAVVWYLNWLLIHLWYSGGMGRVLYGVADHRNGAS